MVSIPSGGRSGRSRKGLDPRIVVALIGAVSVVIAAILTSPILSSLIQYTPKTSAPMNTAFKTCNVPPESKFRPIWEAHKNELGCPTTTASIVKKAVDEAFQGGRMFWNADIDQTYIIYDRKLDGTELFYGDWKLNPVNQKWDGSYSAGVNLTPPKGMYEPVRGFGWLWRTYYGAQDGALGWALDRERNWENFITTQLDPPRTAFYQVRNLVEQVADCGEMAIGSGPVFQS